MKNKLIKWLSVAFSFIIIMTIFTSCSEKEGKPLLAVNKQDITNLKDNKVKVYPEYARLPLIDILTALGFKIEWENDKIANISRDGKSYVLNLKELTFTGNEDEDEFNMLEPPPGNSNIYSKVYKREIILDDGTIDSIFTEMGLDIDINIDREQYSDKRPIIVSITEIMD